MRDALTGESTAILTAQRTAPAQRPQEVGKDLGPVKRKFTAILSGPCPWCKSLASLASLFLLRLGYIDPL